MRLATERTTRSSQRIRYGKDGMSLMWIPAQTTVPPRSTARRAAGTSSPAGAKRMAASSGSGGASPDVPGPLRAERERERLRLAVARPREGEDAPALVARDLDDDVGGGAEAVEAEALGVAGHRGASGSR